MRRKTGFRFFIPLFITLVSTAIGFAQKKEVGLQLVYTQQYCGGARPSREMEEELQKPRPYALRKVYVVSDKGKATCAKTDKQGKLIIKLKPGNYKVFERWRYKHEAPGDLPKKQLDKNCLQSEWNRELFRLEVTPDKTNVMQNYEIVEYCPALMPCQSENITPLPQ
jgi:hypothetical protein